jgi:hypothetical protein
LQPEEDEALESANLADMDSAELDEVGEEAIAQMIASDPSMAALFGMDADGGSFAKSLSDTPSLVESQTVSEVELEQMFGGAHGTNCYASVFASPKFPKGPSTASSAEANSSE